MSNEIKIGRTCLNKEIRKEIMEDILSGNIDRAIDYEMVLQLKRIADILQNK